MKTARPQLAPGPPAHFLWGHLREFRRDVLGLMMESTRRYGDMIRFRLGPRVVHLLNHPDHAEHVLQKNHGNFDKQTRSAGFIRAVTGESLLTSNGEAWQRRRRLLQPSFHRSHLARFTHHMTGATAALLDQWRAKPRSGEPLDVASEMMRLTYAIVGRTLFSAETGPEADRIEQAMQVILPHTFGRLGRIVNWPEWFPTLQNRRFRNARRTIDEVVHRIITEHRRSLAAGRPDQDLLTLLLQVRDEETGEGFSDEHLRNETVTLLLAGHETTANALTWTFYLLSRHPAAEERLRREINTVLGDRIPTLEDLPQLAFTKRVLRESMRLYPPIWIIERRVIAEDEVGGFRLPAGSAAVIAPYALHRHPAFWQDPERFDPDRFTESTPPAYLPFGAGPRFCIGSEFALLEAQLILTMVTQSFRLQPVRGHPVEPLPGITLRARHGLQMRLEPTAARR